MSSPVTEVVYQYVVKKAVVIVAGAWEGSEVFDRPLAYATAGELTSKGFPRGYERCLYT